LIEGMPRPLPPYCRYETTRHGRTVIYFKRPKGKRVRMPADPASPEFAAAYAAAFGGQSAPQKAKGARCAAGSLSWLIATYRASSDYLGLSAATRRQRDNIYQQIEATAGDRPFAAIDRKAIMAGKERRKATPAQARNFLDAMRGLFRWALDHEHVTVDPTDGVRNPPRPKGGGFPVWTADEVAAYRAHWPLGTRERVWMEVLAGTGLRRGDAVTVGRQHVSEGMIELRTAKEGVAAYVPITPTLRAALDAGPTGDLVFIVGANGRPLAKETFGNMMRAACNAAGVRKSSHGLRKYLATGLAEAGLSEAEIEAIMGWVRGSGMAAHYSKEAGRKALAENAAKRIMNGATAS
jgi:integrase